MSATRFWTFFCSPHVWEVDRFLADGNKTGTYRVKSWHKDLIKAGDFGLIRVGIDKRNMKTLDGRPKLQPGVYAVVKVLEDPKLQKNEAHELDYFINEEDKGLVALKVKIEYVENLIKHPVYFSTVKSNPLVLEDLYLVRGFQSSTMPLEESVFNEIIRLSNINLQ